MSVIINGGGMTGAILALILSKLTNGNLEIYLIEQNNPNFYNAKTSLNMSPGVIALSRGAYYELIQMNTMNSMLSSCATIIKQVEISDYNNQFHTIHINAKDYKLPELGYVIELNTFKKKLFNFLHKNSTVNIFCPASLKEIKRRKGDNIIVLNNGCRIVSRLIVAADGTNSMLSDICGIRRIRRDYQQIAVVTTVRTEIPHFGRAFEKFTEYGPLAVLPMSSDLSFFIWCISNKQHKEIASWNKRKFSYELQNIFGWNLGKIVDVGERFFHTLCLTYAQNHISHRLALVGNAAQSLHPIAGQGFNLGLRDVIVLSKIITQALFKNIDIGDYSVLSLYQKRRYLDQYKTIAITDSLVRLFNNRYFPCVFVRNLGFFLVSYNSFLRYLLVNAMLNWETV